MQLHTSLFQEDETAWLEAMASLLDERRFAEIDIDHLSEYLRDMARRDKREVLSRLTILLAHLLKWEYQPGQRNNSWQGTIAVQRRELADLLESKTLLNYAREVLAKAYGRAVDQAALEMGVPDKSFSADCPFAWDEILQGNGGE